LPIRFSTRASEARRAKSAHAAAAVKTFDHHDQPLWQTQRNAILPAMNGDSGQASSTPRWKGTIRVTHVVTRLSPSGATGVILELIEQLDPALFAKPVILCVQDRGTVRIPSDLADVAAVPITKSWRGDFSYARKISACLRQHHTDIIHSHFLPDKCFKFALIPALLAGKLPVINTLHSTIIKPDADIRTKLCYWAAARFSRAIVAVSQSAGQQLKQFVRLPPDRLTYIPNGMNLNRLAEQPDGRMALRTELNCRDEEIIIGHAGRLSPEKGQDLLLRAFSILCRHRHGLRLVLAGEGSSREALQQLSSDLRIEGTVHILGHRTDILQLMDGFDLFVLPSRVAGQSYTEGQALTIIEAQIRGIPVVATAAGGNPELVLHQQTGWICPADDPEALAAALNNALDHPDLTRQWVEAAKTRAYSEFNSDTMARRYERIYLDLLHKGS